MRWISYTSPGPLSWLLRLAFRCFHVGTRDLISKVSYEMLHYCGFNYFKLENRINFFTLLRKKNLVGTPRSKQ